MTKLTLALCAAVASLGVAVAASAESKPVPIDVGAFAGGHFFSDTNGLGRAHGASTDNRLKHGGMFGIRLGVEVHPRVVLEGEVAMIPTSTATPESQVLAFGFRAQMLVNILTGCVRPFILVGGGGFTSSPSNPDVLKQDTDGEIHWGVGVKIDFTEQLGLRVDARMQFSPATAGSYFTQDYEVNAGLFGVFPGKASCCKRHAPPADKPPVVAVVAKPAALADRDGDGVPDVSDHCVDRAGIAENAGCPDVDADADGVVDRLDKCPSVAGRPDLAGCPDADTDGDGVVDRLDKCPAQPETANGYQDDDGCPDEMPAQMKKFSGALRGITFKTGGSQILASSFPLLDEAAKLLTDNPTLRVEIAGHTDKSGNHDANVALSQSRAEAVRAYLIKHGVAGERLVAKGYGPDKPIAEEKTAAGKAQNRRVEFVFLH